MELRILTDEGIDEVIGNVKTIIVVDNYLIVKATQTYKYNVDTILFYQCYVPRGE